MRQYSAWVVCVLWVFSTATEAQEGPCQRDESACDCMRNAATAHVLAQIATYGPLSRDREYFGFVYVLHGEIGSAIARGRRCWSFKECSIDTAQAAQLIPKGAKVLGEWHTHPHEGGAESLSIDDVRGAYNNRQIRCYAAYYSQPNGRIYAWDPKQSMVSDALTSRFYLGNYRSERRLGARRSDSGN